MMLLFLLWGLEFLMKVSSEEFDLINNTNSDKDLYVIHATVYQVGILTNKTDNMTDGFNSTGNLESLTFYHTNGSNIDLSVVPQPLLTNITAQSMVGVAPIPKDGNQKNVPSWDDLKVKTNSEDHSNLKRSTSNMFRLFRRDVHSDSVKMTNGTAVILPEASVQSIALPPLLSLNNNLSNIPVPIPNTSVVHYAKVNTLIQKP